MPKPIINGTLGPILQPLEISYDPTRGALVQLSWESAGEGLSGVANNLLQARIAYQFTPNPRRSRVVASASGPQAGYPEVIVDNWQILANELQKDLRQHPDVLAMEAAYPGTIGYVMRDADLYNQGLPAGTPAPDPGANPTAAYLFALLKAGSTHYAYAQYVLKHTTNVSNVYQSNVADVNVDKIYTMDQLIKEVSNANAWIFPLPGRLIYKLQQIAAPAARTGYLWGWRKLGTTEITSATNRVDLSTEYWLEQWGSPLPYKPAVLS